MDKTLKQYHLVNNVIGWLIGIIACVVYIMTAEATASWWDCGEYIATAYKVQVGHPPGAPTFQILGRLFSLFSDPYHAAFAVNVLSAISSGLGIMFLYWTITLLTKKLLKPEDLALNNTKVWAVFASGIVGSLAYTFTDTYWFSAVEGEVYAMSSFFTAVVFWAILKWDEQSEDKHSMRWLILISFLVGIAIGVHLLNLLTIPAIVYVVYFKKYPKTTLKGFLVSGGISLVLLAVVLWGVIPGIVNLSSDFDVFFVNKLHMGFNTGTVVFFLIIACFVAWGIWNNSHFNRPSKAVNVTIVNEKNKIPVELKWGEGAEELSVQTNEQAATRALVLLLDNAERFTKEGSITLTIEQKGDKVQFVVEDTGIGIPASEAEHIFEEFVQLNEYSVGTGIGLTVARSICRRMGGDIVLDTSYTEGARFVMTLPL